MASRLERAFLASLVIGASILSSCSDNKQIPVNSVTVPITISGPTPKNLEFTAIPLPEVIQYYPELSKLPLQAEGFVITEKSITHWLNFDQRVKVNEKAMEETYRFFEDLAATQTTFNYNLDGTIIPMTIIPAPKTRRVLFIAPNDAPLPSWAGSPFATSTDIFNTDEYITFIRIPDDENVPKNSFFHSPLAYATSSFATEGMQTSSTYRAPTKDLANLAHEIIPNSVGKDFAAVQLNVPDFLDTAQKISIGPGSDDGYPLYVSPELHASIPKIGLPFTLVK